ncbi:FkbM family methyltransferase [Halpernia frigidisoli]|uniref:Methyltransferase, FkbM family n=1 Tax=Halpernia frigidisoli TaxID=1125876 RepID=A0A1I3GLY3_9FLAO|nr:FkbM family methyltransferase [Halpernia frigidisoli]SFI24291.1 methyltransferase, FkbM family [Halpernia frigidisoli]
MNLKLYFSIISNYAKIALIDIKYLVTPNETTGITNAERMRLKNYPKLKKGSAKFFDVDFYFNDVGGFMHTVDEVFSEKVYKFEADKPEPYIIDCGSNIGISLYYFQKLYPNAEIIGFEPDPEIYRILQNNVSNFSNKNIKIYEEAVWTQDTELIVYSEGSLAGSATVDYLGTNKKTTVKAFDLKKLMTKEIDFLKIDIEGAENEVIFDIKDKLFLVKNLFLEYHGLAGKRQNLGDILNLLRDAGFEYYIRLAGENIKYPFCNEQPVNFNQQLNIFCFRKK